MEKEIVRISTLLFRKAQGLLTEAEQAQLEAWLAESAENTKLLHCLENRKENARLFNQYISVDTKTARKEMEMRLGRKNGIRKRTILGVSLGAACAALLLLIILRVGMPGERLLQNAEIALMPAASPTFFFDLGGKIILEGSNLEMLDDRVIVRRENQVPVVISESSGENIKSIYTTIHVPRGTQYTIFLEDGTRVWLNAESRLKYPLFFRGDTREVELSGEAFFDVAEDFSRPFRVIAGPTTVEVLGTRFNINAYTEEMIQTTLLEGSIRILSGEKEHVLTPGMEAVTTAHSSSIRPVNASRIASWREGMFVLENRTLEAVMADLASWYDFTLYYDDENLKNISFKGAVPRAENMASVLEILKMTGEVDFRIKNDKVIVKK